MLLTAFQCLTVLIKGEESLVDLILFTTAFDGLFLEFLQSFLEGVDGLFLSGCPLLQLRIEEREFIVFLLELHPFALYFLPPQDLSF